MLFRLEPRNFVRSILRPSSISREEIIILQNKLLRRLVKHAYERVPYYRRLFQAHGVRPEDVQTVADLSAIPVTSRNGLQSSPLHDVVASGVDTTRLILRRTSGSSGEPFVVRRTWSEERILNAFRKRALHHLGMQVTDKIAEVGRIRPIQPADNQAPSKILQALGLYRHELVDCYLEPREIVRSLRDIGPDILTGFPGVISRVAQAVDPADLNGIHLRFIAVDSEVLTPLMRRQIAEAFQAPVFNIYDSHEFNAIAWECKETGAFHVCDDGLIIEVLKDGRPAAPGERGEVVGTNLHSYAMPFVRYRLGDIVTQGLRMCKCGQPFSTIQAVQGRMIDYFPLPDGRMLHPYKIMAFLLDQGNWVRQYQFVQKSEHEIILEVMPHGTPSQEDLSMLSAAIATILGAQVTFRVHLVPEIQFEPTGKFRVSRSFVKSNYDGIDWEQEAG